MPRGYVYALVAAVLLLSPAPVLGADTASTSSAECRSTTEAENEALARRWHEDVINRRDPAQLDQILSTEVVHHASGGYPARMKADGVRSMMQDFLDAFPDLRYEFTLLTARGDMVIERYTASGTQSGQFGDLAPTGRKARWTGINIFRIECGRIAEVWSEVDALGRWRQLTGAAQ